MSVKDNKFLRGTKNNNLSSSISNNILNHPGSKSGREENSNIINVISTPDDNKNDNDVEEVTSNNMNKKDKNNANVKSWQHPQSAMSYAPPILSKIPKTKHRHHAYSANVNRPLD